MKECALPLVSIIVPTFNRGNIIAETLNSIKAQTYTNWECIIVDDGSHDNTFEVVNEFIQNDDRFQFHIRPKNRLKGGNAARNFGYELSKGEFINWFDSDDIMRVDKIEKQVSQLISSNLNFSTCQTLVFEENLQNVIGLRSDKIYSKNLFQDYLEGNIIWLTQAPIWRKSFLQSLDYLFDENLLVSQEWEFFCRILYNNNELNVIEEPLVFSRKHFYSKSYSDVKNVDGYIEARKRLYSYLKDKKLSTATLTYFGNYFVSNYKKKLFGKNYQSAFKLLKESLLTFEHFRSIYKFKLVLAFFLFIILNKGEFILKGQKYKTYNDR